MKYGEWLNTWLALYVKPTVKIRTYEKYAQIVRVQVIPFLGDCILEELSAVQLQKFIVGLIDKYAPNTVNNVITILQKSLKTAVTVGVTDKQHSDKIQRPKITEKKVECFTMAEQKKIEQFVLTAKKTKLFGVVLCLYTGLRIGELLALEWSDIDLKKGLLSVNKSCHYGKDGNGIYTRIIDTPKTAQSVRDIPLPKSLIEYIKDLKKRSNCKYVLSDKDGAIPTRSYQRSFELLLQKLKIPRRGFHALRHTFATRALESGMDIKTLSEILGHKNPTVTLNRYVHSLMEHKAEMMNQLGKFCGLKTKEKTV